jgi:hypothetical protein
LGAGGKEVDFPFLKIDFAHNFTDIPGKVKSSLIMSCSES